MSDQVKAVFASTSVDVGGGVSNTPHRVVVGCSGINYVNKDGEFQKVVHACVDWFRATFDLDGPFSPSEHYWSELFRILRLDPKQSGECRAKDGYKEGRLLSEDTCFYSGGERTRSSLGNETGSLDISGHGLRAFEDRVLAEHVGGTSSAKAYAMNAAWYNFLREIVRLGGRCSRIDLPTDDTTGIVPFAQLKRKLEERCYTSRFRKCDFDQSFPVDDEAVPVHSRGCLKKGYTVYLGTKASLELCIYDKKAQQEALGVRVVIPSWIRYEVRYYHDNAASALAGLLFSFGDSVAVSERCDKKGEDFNSVVAKSGYTDCGPADFIVGCLRGLLCPLERKVSKGNQSKGAVAKVWKPWQEFVSGSPSMRVFAAARPELTLNRNAAWLYLDACKAFGRLVAGNPENSLDVYRYLLNSGISRMDAKDLSAVNAYRLKRHLAPYKDVSDLVGSVCSSENGVDLLADVSPEVLKLFRNPLFKVGESRYSYEGYGDDEIPDGLKKKGGSGK